jgi:hypothetical protein
MISLHRLLVKACGSVAVALLAIALAMAAQNATADVPNPPGDPCPCLPEETQEECDARCASVCDVSCAAAYPQCGNGSCAAPDPVCSKYKCKLILTVKVCECNMFDD